MGYYRLKHTPPVEAVQFTTTDKDLDQIYTEYEKYGLDAFTVDDNEGRSTVLKYGVRVEHSLESIKTLNNTDWILMEDGVVVSVLTDVDFRDQYEPL